MLLAETPSFLKTIPVEQSRPGDCNCENFAFEVLPHTTPNGSICNPGIIIYAHNLEEGVGGVGRWQCPHCGSITSVFVPLNSDME